MDSSFEFNENCALTPGCCFEKVAAPSYPVAPSDILKVKYMGLHFLYVLKNLSKFRALKRLLAK